MSPIHPRDCQAIESFHKLKAKLIKGLRHVPYEAALQRLRHLSLVRRRIRGDLLNFPRDTVFAAPRIGLRGHTFKIHQTRSKTRHPQHAISVRVVS